MKRPMTLVSGILGIVAHAVGLVYTFIATIGLIPAFGQVSFTALLPILLMVLAGLAVSIVGLIFNIKALLKWNKSAEVYGKKASLIVALVFNVLGIVMAFLLMSIILAVLLMLVFVAAVVLTIVDLCLEGKRK